jgi:hypothetical protein
VRGRYAFGRRRDVHVVAIVDKRGSRTIANDLGEALRNPLRGADGRWLERTVRQLAAELLTDS